MPLPNNLESMYQRLEDQGFAAGTPYYQGNQADAFKYGMDRSMQGFNPVGGQWMMPFTNEQGSSTSLQYIPPADSTFGYNTQGQLVSLGGAGGSGRGKTTEELAAEQAARNAEIANRKAMYDAQMNQQFSGNFDFLNQPMEVDPFKVVNGQAIMGRPTYGGKPPEVGNMSMSSAFNARSPQMAPGVNAQGQQNGQVDMGQMYSLFQNPYLAELATLLFGNSSWLK